MYRYILLSFVDVTKQPKAKLSRPKKNRGITSDYLMASIYLLKYVDEAFDLTTTFYSESNVSMYLTFRAIGKIDI